MYERESIFSKPVPPLLGYQGLDATLCPACSIPDAIAKFRAFPEGWGPGSVGRRGCCRLGWPPRLSSWAGVWLCSCPGPSFLPWPPQPSRHPQARTGFLLYRGGGPPRAISRTPAGPEQLRELREQSGSWPTGPALLFQALSCRGSLGLFWATSSHCKSSVGFYYVLNFPLCCCFSFRAETVWSPCC